MLGANDIREVTFNRGMSGYKAPEVDAFIDQCAGTVAELTNSNKDLERKLEILADKLEEYRKDEDSIRTALLSAQRMGDTVVREANKKAGLILEDAKIKAENMQEAAKRNIKEEEHEYERIRKEVTAFKSHLLSMYREHLALIDILPEEDAEEKEQKAENEEKAPEVNEQAEESSVEPATAGSVADEPAAAEPEEPVFEPVEETASEQAVPEEQSKVVMDIPVLQDDTAETPAASSENLPKDEKAEKSPASRFTNLKFGEDYDISKDEDNGPSGFFKHRK